MGKHCNTPKPSEMTKVRTGLNGTIPPSLTTVSSCSENQEISKRGNCEQFKIFKSSLKESWITWKCICNIFSLHNCKFDTLPTNEPDRSKCGLIPWLPWHPMPVNHLPTREGKAQVRVESAWGPLDPSPSSPPCLGRGRFTRLPAPLTYALPTPPPPHDYPCLAQQLLHTPHICAPNLHACCVLGQRLQPINFQLRVGRLTFPVKKLFQGFLAH